MNLALSFVLVGTVVAAGADSPQGPVRHIVMYKYVDSNTPEQTQSAIDAFLAMRGKIDLIKGLEWGVDNSPEGLADGLTHCFLVTFADVASRDAYLPHPEHKAYAAFAKPLREKVLVFDYVPHVVVKAPEKPKAGSKGVLRHVVLFKFKEDVMPEQVKQVEDAFLGLPGKIDTIKGFEWGTNISEEGKSAGFTHCFLLTFEDEKGRDAYLPHPEHKAFGKVLGPYLEKVCVVDYIASE